MTPHVVGPLLSTPLPTPRRHPLQESQWSEAIQWLGHLRLDSEADPAPAAAGATQLGLACRAGLEYLGLFADPRAVVRLLPRGAAVQEVEGVIRAAVNRSTGVKVRRGAHLVVRVQAVSPPRPRRLTRSCCF